MLDHQDPISIPALASKGPVYVSAVLSYSPAYDAPDVKENDDLVTALLAQI